MTHYERDKTMPSVDEMLCKVNQHRNRPASRFRRAVVAHGDELKRDVAEALSLLLMAGALFTTGVYSAAFVTAVARGLQLVPPWRTWRVRTNADGGGANQGSTSGVEGGSKLSR